MDAARARAELVELFEDGDDAPLDRAVALLEAEERPGEADPEQALAGLDALARGVRIPAGASAFDALARLNHHLYVDQGFKGDVESYDDPLNSCLGVALERRRGLPILLSVIAIEVGRRAGLSLRGIGFPGHFLVSPTGAEPRFFVDPFRGGQILREDTLRARLARMAGGPVGPSQWEEATAVAGPRAILVRMSNNLKGTFFRRGELVGTLRSVDRLIALEPGEPEHWRDRGWLLVRLGRPREAASEYDRYLSVRPTAEDAEEIRGELGAIRGSR